MSKSRNFSVYLLKDKFNINNINEAFKEADSDLVRLPENHTNMPNVVIYVKQIKGNQPWWKEYWGISQELSQSSASAIVFLPVAGRVFAITFGSSYHHLHENAYEYDFGLKTTLNALDPEKVKSTDFFSPETSKRSRVQSPTGVSLTYLDFNKDENIVKKLTGAVKTQYSDLMRNVTGSIALRFSSARSCDELPGLCSSLLDIYNNQEYAKSFPDLQSIVPIKDPSLIDKLNSQLLEAFSTGGPNLSLSVPDIVDYSTSFKVKYQGSGKCQNCYEDVYLSDYHKYINDSTIEDISVFKNHYLLVLDDDGKTLQKFSIYKSFLFDCNYEDRAYHLCEGNWYEIKSDYLDKLKKLDNLFIEKHKFLIDNDKKREEEYNRLVADHSQGEVVCLDKQNIAPFGSSQMEPCDLITLHGAEVEFIHNKVSTRSSSLSHLFNQGVNSVVLLRQNPEAKNKLKHLIKDNQQLVQALDNAQYRVTYGIITTKAAELKSNALPLFSRISLFRAWMYLKVLQVDVSVFLIQDRAERNGTSKKTDTLD